MTGVEFSFFYVETGYAKRKFLATLVALHFTPVSKCFDGWVIVSVGGLLA